MSDESKNKICGREYTTHKGVDLHPPKTFFMKEVKDEKGGKKKVRFERPSFYIKPHVRFLVTGINHPRGEPIRFKALSRAENHIKNMGLAIAS